MKTKRIIALGLSIIMSAQAFSTVAFASNNINETSIYTITEKSTLSSPQKEEQLMEIAKQLNLTEQEVQELRDLYNKHSSTTMPMGKIGIITKIVKVSKPIIIKAAKAIGIKISEKTFADFTDFLFDWQGNLQDGIESFLINYLNFNETVAYWTAKTIMFVAF